MEGGKERVKHRPISRKSSNDDNDGVEKHAV